MFGKDNGMDITGISTYVIIIIFIIIFIWYVQPSIFSDGKEDYAPTRERTDPQSDWNIVEKIEAIKAMQSKYFSRFTQNPNYGV